MADVTRRGFLRGLGLLAGGIALEQAIPLGRVWSFPQNIVIAEPEVLWPGGSLLNCVALQLEAVQHLIPTLYQSDDLLFNTLKGDARGLWVPPDRRTDAPVGHVSIDVLSEDDWEEDDWEEMNLEVLGG